MNSARPFTSDSDGRIMLSHTSDFIDANSSRITSKRPTPRNVSGRSEPLIAICTPLRSVITPSLTFALVVNGAARSSSNCQYTVFAMEKTGATIHTGFRFEFSGEVADTIARMHARYDF